MTGTFEDKEAQGRACPNRIYIHMGWVGGLFLMLNEGTAKGLPLVYLFTGLARTYRINTFPLSERCRDFFAIGWVENHRSRHPTKDP
jgi:hypothetical protein